MDMLYTHYNEEPRQRPPLWWIIEQRGNWMQRAGTPITHVWGEELHGPKEGYKPRRTAVVWTDYKTGFQVVNLYNHTVNIMATGAAKTTREAYKIAYKLLRLKVRAAGNA